MMAVNFIGGRNRSTRRKPSTWRVIGKLYYIVLYRVHLVWAGLELTTLVLIVTKRTYLIRYRLFLKNLGNRSLLQYRNNDKTFIFFSEMHFKAVNQLNWLKNIQSYELYYKTGNWFNDIQKYFLTCTFILYNNRLHTYLSLMNRFAWRNILFFS